MSAATDSLRRWAATIPMVSGAASILASCILLNLSTKHIRERRQRDSVIRLPNRRLAVYERIGIGLSCDDIFTSLAAYLSAMFSPDDCFTIEQPQPVPLCTTTGYAATLGFLTSAICNYFLALFFYLTIHRGLRRVEEFVTFRRVAFVAAVGVPNLPLTALGLTTQSFTSNSLTAHNTCWATYYEYECCSEICSRGSMISWFV